MRGQTVKSPERVAEARRLRAAGWKFREIAERFGVAVSTADTWVRDPDLQIQSKRRETYAVPCVDCGRPTSGCQGGGARKAERCGDCGREVALRRGDVVRFQQADERYGSRIEEMYRAGVPLREMARRLGIPKNTLAGRLGRMRALGYDLGYRHRGYPKRDD